MEVELKFRLTAETQRAVLAYLADMKLPKPATRRLISHYYDFPDRSLRGAGFSLRIRKTGRRHEQTLKAAGTGGAAAQRSEWTWRLASGPPDIARLAWTPAAGIFAQKTDNGIEQIFVTDIKRTAYRLTLEGGTVAELAIDNGAVRANGHSESLRELEIELNAGPVGPLYRFAAALHEACPLNIAVGSKADRGYRLLTGKPPAAAKTDGVRLAAHVDVAHGLRRIVGSGLGQLAANLPLCSVGDPEPLHQARIAIRRIRSALALFKPCLEPGATERFEDTLRRFGRVLGAGRDHDVFAKDIRKTMSEAGRDGAWLPLLIPVAETNRRNSYRQVQALIRSHEPTGFILALAGWLESDLWEAPGIRSQRLADSVPKLLDRLRKKALKRGRHLETRPPPELHALRKTLKKLRYSVEFCASLYPAKDVKRYRKGCKDVLDVLGEINDTIGAEARLEGLPMRDSALTPAIGLVGRMAVERRKAAAKKLGDAWRDFASEKPFWS